MSHRVLIIEDDARIAEFLVRGLREEGYQIAHAADGPSGWTHLATGQFDLVLLDGRLPGEDGLQLLKRLREKRDMTPVLFLTARDGVAQRVAGLDAGADDYLCKPFAFDELLARMRALLRRPANQETAALAYDDVAVDLLRRSATRAGHALDLTAKEFSLLVFFLRQPERVLTRTRIYDQVWDDQYDGLSNTLEVHIKELRRKLEQHGVRLIQTRRGQGYVLSSRAAEG